MALGYRILKMRANIQTKTRTISLWRNDVSSERCNDFGSKFRCHASVVAFEEALFLESIYPTFLQGISKISTFSPALHFLHEIDSTFLYSSITHHSSLIENDPWFVYIAGPIWMNPTTNKPTLHTTLFFHLNSFPLLFGLKDPPDSSNRQSWTCFFDCFFFFFFLLFLIFSSLHENFNLMEMLKARKTCFAVFVGFGGK